jgi:hypothetical protein
VNTMIETWNTLALAIRQETGRTLHGTPGGQFVWTDSGLYVPMGNIEGVIHEVAHWLVSSEEERRMPNLGLVEDWLHPRWQRSVRNEEEAWSLEFWLFGDPTVARMASFLTPEALRGGGGGYISAQENSKRGYYPPPRMGSEEPEDEPAEEDDGGLTDAAKAELYAAAKMIADETLEIRESALRKGAKHERLLRALLVAVRYLLKADDAADDDAEPFIKSHARTMPKKRRGQRRGRVR